MRQYITRRVALLLATVAFALSVPLAVIASHQFTDVPNSNIFHADIDALADSGVTTGCSATRYCPNDFVTRGQMAAFLNRLGALAPGKTPVVNATKIDGFDSTAFHRFSASAPAGGTEYGSFSASGVAAGASSFDAAYITFPVPLAAAPASHVITPGDPVPAGCTGGTASSPRAASGHLCIFVAYELNTTGTYNVFNPVTGTGGTSRLGAILDLRSAAAGNYAITGTWAANGTATLAFDDPNATGGAALGQ